MRPRQNGCHFPDDIFKCIFLNESIWISIGISLRFVPKGPINNIPALVQIMAWRRPGDKSLSEPLLVCLLTHIYVTWPQWVNYSYGGGARGAYLAHGLCVRVGRCSDVRKIMLYRTALERHPNICLWHFVILLDPDLAYYVMFTRHLSWNVFSEIGAYSSALASNYDVYQPNWCCSQATSQDVFRDT